MDCPLNGKYYLFKDQFSYLYFFFSILQKGHLGVALHRNRRFREQVSHRKNWEGKKEQQLVFAMLLPFYSLWILVYQEYLHILLHIAPLAWIILKSLGNLEGSIHQVESFTAIIVQLLIILH